MKLRTKTLEVLVYHLRIQLETHLMTKKQQQELYLKTLYLQTSENLLVIDLVKMMLCLLEKNLQK